MSSIGLQKTVLVQAARDRVLSCLQDPLFWALLPGGFHLLDLHKRPLSIGDSLKTGLETYRLAAVSRESVYFTSKALGLRFVAEAVDEDTCQLTADITVENPACATTVLLDETDNSFLAIAELFEKSPHYGWVSEIRMRYESAPKGLEMQIWASVDLPYDLAAVESTLVLQPSEYDKWIDPEMQSGTLDVDSSWPARGSTVQYRYPKPFWFLPPFGRWNTGSIRIADWTPGQHVELRDRSEPGGVRTDREFKMRETPGGTRLEMHETSVVAAWAPRLFYGKFIRQAIPLESAKSLCEFVAVLSRLHYPVKNGSPAGAGLVCHHIARP